LTYNQRTEMDEDQRHSSGDQQMKTIGDTVGREWDEQALHAMIAESRIEVRDGFADRVMAALPAAAWQRRLGRRRAPVWALPAAAAAIFAGGAAVVLGFAAGGAETHAFGIFAAVFDFLRATTLAGAGLLFATWRGVGFGLEELIAESGLNLLALASAVVFLNLFFVQLLRRRPAAVRQAADPRHRD
jgi:hypothetical protein